MKSSVWVLSAVKWVLLGWMTACAATQTLQAQDADPRPTQPWQKEGWLIRVYGVGAYSDDDNDGLFDWDTAGGIGVNGAYRVNDRFSVELSTAIMGDTDDDWDWHWHYDDDGDFVFHDPPHDDDDDFFMIPNMLSFNFHLTPKSRVDLHIGPSIGFVHFGEFERYEHDGDGHHHHHDDDHWHLRKIDSETEAALGWNIGLDIPLGRSQKWAIYTSIQGFATDADHEAFNDTWHMGKVGVGYKF